MGEKSTAFSTSQKPRIPDNFGVKDAILVSLFIPFVLFDAKNHRLAKHEECWVNWQHFECRLEISEVQKLTLDRKK